MLPAAPSNPFLREGWIEGGRVIYLISMGGLGVSRLPCRSLVCPVCPHVDFVYVGGTAHTADELRLVTNLFVRAATVQPNSTRKEQTGSAGSHLRFKRRLPLGQGEAT